MGDDVRKIEDQHLELFQKTSVEALKCQKMTFGTALLKLTFDVCCGFLLSVTFIASRLLTHKKKKKQNIGNIGEPTLLTHKNVQQATRVALLVQMFFLRNWKLSWKKVEEE